MAGNSQGGGSTIVTGVQPPQKPLNLLNAVSEIQQFGAIEVNMAQQLNKNYFTTQNRVDFFTIGLKNAITHLFFTIIFTPLSVGVIDNLIHLFGDKNLSLFDRIYALFLSLSISIGFAIFLSSLKNSYVGTVSKAMIRSLFEGLLFGEIFKVLVSFLVYQFIYIQMTPEHIVSFLLFLHKYFRPLLIKLNFNYLSAFHWLLNFRDVFPLAELLILVSSVILVAVPISIIMFSAYKGKKGIENL
ncbi:MAG: hypothetical protein QXO58_05965, partial [Thermoplasmata archaeon]